MEPQKKKDEASPSATRVGRSSSGSPITPKATRSAILRGETNLSRGLDDPEKINEGSSAGNSSASPSPRKATRSAIKRGEFRLEPPLENPEPHKNRKKVTTVFIEFCPQIHPIFEQRANEIKEGLENSDIPVRVVFNPDPPRVGFFEIRGEDDDNIFLTISKTKKPFARLNNLDVERLIPEIIQWINESMA